MLSTPIENAIVVSTFSKKILARPEKGKRRRRVHKLLVRIALEPSLQKCLILTAWGKVADALSVILKTSTRLSCTIHVSSYTGKVYDPFTKQPLLNADGSIATTLKYNLTVAPTLEIYINDKLLERGKCIICGKPLTDGKFIGKECATLSATK